LWHGGVTRHDVTSFATDHVANGLLRPEGHHLSANRASGQSWNDTFEKAGKSAGGDNYVPRLEEASIFCAYAGAASMLDHDLAGSRVWKQLHSRTRSCRQECFDERAIVDASFIGKIGRCSCAARYLRLHLDGFVERKRLGRKAEGVVASNERAELAFRGGGEE